MSKFTVLVMATTQPVSTSSRSPGRSSRSTIVPPAWMNTRPSPVSFCMMKPSPPNSAVMIFFWKNRPMDTPRAAHRKLSFCAMMVPP